MKATTKVAVATAAAAGAGAVALAAQQRARRATVIAGGNGHEIDGAEQLVVEVDDGAVLAVTVAGAEASGPTVVLAHCWMGGPAIWAPVANQLVRAGRRVVLYDQRGHGASTVGGDGFTVERLGGDLLTVLEAVDASDAVLAGHSMGGMTIQSLAAHHPGAVVDRVAAIVLVATAACGLSRGRLDAPAARLIGHPRVDRVLSGRMGHRFVRGAVGKDVQRHHLELTRDLVVACAPDVRTGWLRAMSGMDLRAAIAGIAVPTAVMVGTHDRLTPPARAAEIVAAVPGARLVTLPRAGHMLPLERPDEVAATILAMPTSRPATGEVDGTSEAVSARA